MSIQPQFRKRFFCCYFLGRLLEERLIEVQWQFSQNGDALILGSFAQLIKLEQLPKQGANQLVYSIGGFFPPWLHRAFVMCAYSFSAYSLCILFYSLIRLHIPEGLYIQLLFSIQCNEYVCFQLKKKKKKVVKLPLQNGYSFSRTKRVVAVSSSYQGWNLNYGIKEEHEDWIFTQRRQKQQSIWNIESNSARLFKSILQKKGKLRSYE